MTPGKVFTRRLYSLTTTKTGVELKKNHHVKLTLEAKHDLQMWLKFLNHPTAVCRNFMDFSEILLPVYSETSTLPKKGGGSSFNVTKLPPSLEP